MDITQKKLLFIGPLGRLPKNYINSFDYVIRTNNFFGINKKYLTSDRCDILVANPFCVRNRHELIMKNISNIKYLLIENSSIILLKNKYPHLSKYFHKFILFRHNKNKHSFVVDGEPLLLTRFIYFLLEKKYNPKKLMVTGLDFYYSKNISNFWLPGYSIKGDKESKKLVSNCSKHNPVSNAQYFKYIMKNIKWITCDSNINKILSKIC